MVHAGLVLGRALGAPWSVIARFELERQHQDVALCTGSSLRLTPLDMAADTGRDRKNAGPSDVPSSLAWLACHDMPTPRRSE